MTTTRVRAVIDGAARLLDLGGTLIRRPDASYEEATVESMQRAWKVIGDELGTVIDLNLNRIVLAHLRERETAIAALNAVINDATDEAHTTDDAPDSILKRAVLQQFLLDFADPFDKKAEPQVTLERYETLRKALAAIFKERDRETSETQFLRRENAESITAIRLKRHLPIKVKTGANMQSHEHSRMSNP